jgi:hypothetical protein
VTGLSASLAACILFGVLLAATRRKWTSFAGTIYVMLAVLLSSWIKQRYQGMAMTLGDVRWFFLHPIENFELFIKYPQLGGAFLAICAGAAGVLIFGWRREQPAIRKLVTVLTIGIGVLGSMARPTPNDVKLHGDAFAAWLSMTEMLQPTGWVSRLDVFFENWDSTATLPVVRKQTRFKRTPHDGKAPAQRLPDILMVFEESTLDPTIIAKCRFPQCDSAMLHPLPFAASTQEGPLVTHTTGGGSWLTEFALLAGLDWRFFGRGGRLAPVSLAPRVRVSLPNRLKALGYRTIAIYPTDGEFLGAKTAYEHYGFDEFYSARDLHFDKGWFETRDSLVFEKALAAADRPNDTRPVFLLVLTIRNHGPYRTSELVLSEEFKPIGREMSVEFADYLYRMQDSSKDYVALAERWLSSPRSRVIGWFGDHQPEPAWAFLENRYLTRYQLSSNELVATSTSPVSTLDVAYLGDELFAFAGLPLDDTAKAGLDIVNECNGLLFDCTNRELVQDYISYRVYELKSIE